MACVTLKRSLDFDPLHSPTRPNKRRRCVPLHCPEPPKNTSVFKESPLTPEQIANNLRDEIKRLKKRRQIAGAPCGPPSPRSAPGSPEPMMETENNNSSSQAAAAAAATANSQTTAAAAAAATTASPASSSLAVARGASSTTSPSSSSSSTLAPQSSRHALQQSGSSLNTNSSSSSSSSSSHFPAYKQENKPIFTLKQMTMIAERMCKERVDQVRSEYDQILQQKLSEQYESFVKFIDQQIQRRFNESQVPSYLS